MAGYSGFDLFDLDIFYCEFAVFRGSGILTFLPDPARLLAKFLSLGIPVSFDIFV